MYKPDLRAGSIVSWLAMKCVKSISITDGADKFLRGSCDKVAAVMLAKHVCLKVSLGQFLVAHRTHGPLLHALQDRFAMFCVPLTLALANSISVAMIMRRMALPHPIRMLLPISFVLAHLLPTIQDYFARRPTLYSSTYGVIVPSS